MIHEALQIVRSNAIAVLEPTPETPSVHEASTWADCTDQSITGLVKKSFDATESERSVAYSLCPFVSKSPAHVIGDIEQL
mmetsp:Transcript_7930/g.16979  ORF Transcript_7930/g.16979 Transcript_7930/m.16979 type:complete len:80 (-) Transcript_7930:474-713(-)